MVSTLREGNERWVEADVGGLPQEGAEGLPPTLPDGGERNQ